MHYTATERQRLHTEAAYQAHLLRRQTELDVWRGADALLGGTAHSALRSAQRLAYRLARRQAAMAQGRGE